MEVGGQVTLRPVGGRAKIPGHPDLVGAAGPRSWSVTDSEELLDNIYCKPVAFSELYM
jgi:hypothetical protein